MAAQILRYAIRQEIDCSWTVYDVFTAQAAKPSTWILIDLSEAQASAYCAIINAKDSARRKLGLPTHK
jgi:hypothetical protein